jgi:hypothetical protein
MGACPVFSVRLQPRSGRPCRSPSPPPIPARTRCSTPLSVLLRRLPAFLERVCELAFVLSKAPEHYMSHGNVDHCLTRYGIALVVLAVPRYRPSQPKVRSTIHRLGRAFQRESSRHAFAGAIQEIGEPGASSIRAVPSLHSAGTVSYARRCEHDGVRTIANQSAHELEAQLPCRPQHPRIGTGGKRTAHGVRAVYREQESRERCVLKSPHTGAGRSRLSAAGKRGSSAGRSRPTSSMTWSTPACCGGFARTAAKQCRGPSLIVSRQAEFPMAHRGPKWHAAPKRRWLIPAL